MTTAQKQSLRDLLLQVIPNNGDAQMAVELLDGELAARDATWRGSMTKIFHEITALAEKDESLRAPADKFLKLAESGPLADDASNSGEEYLVIPSFLRRFQPTEADFNACWSAVVALAEDLDVDVNAFDSDDGFAADVRRLSAAMRAALRSCRRVPVVEPRIGTSDPAKAIVSATKRVTLDGIDIECRFANGEKYAPITVDEDHPDLADKILDALTGKEGAR